MDFRHELKFFVTSADLSLIRTRIQHIAKSDSHQKDHQGYTVTSLYFDNINNFCLNENIGGFDHRHKYRLRIYNHSPELIKLERKSKIHGMTSKISVNVNVEECKKMVQGTLPLLQYDYPYDKKRILCEMKLAGMYPKTIVQYNREAFLYDVGNVRITFDENISGSQKIESFLDPWISTTPLLNKGIHILEVKYDNLLPTYLYDALDIEKLMHTSFSKYAYSRRKLG